MALITSGSLQNEERSSFELDRISLREYTHLSRKKRYTPRPPLPPLHDLVIYPSTGRLRLDLNLRPNVERLCLGRLAFHPHLPPSLSCSLPRAHLPREVAARRRRRRRLRSRSDPPRDDLPTVPPRRNEDVHKLFELVLHRSYPVENTTLFLFHSRESAERSLQVSQHCPAAAAAPRPTTVTGGAVGSGAGGPSRLCHLP